MEYREPPYPLILDEMRAGKIVPFLGAGASLCGRKKEDRWVPGESRFLPSGNELAEFLAEYSCFPSAEQDKALARVASYYEMTTGRSSLTEKLTDLFNHDYEPGGLHRLLASMEGISLIVTTNYDDLIERAYQKEDREYHLVTCPVDRKDIKGQVLWQRPGADEIKEYPPAKLPLTVGKEPIIFKMHGGVDKLIQENNSYLITEEDYIEFLSRMTEQTAIPATFKMKFKQSRFLFLGYGLQDWNLRVMLRNINRATQSGTQRDLKSWAIQRNPSELDKALWQKREVDIFNVELSSFVDNLVRRMPAQSQPAA